MFRVPRAAASIRTTSAAEMCWACAGEERMKSIIVADENRRFHQGRQFSFGPVFLATWPDGFWFRVCGYGLSVDRREKSFSERNGYAVAFKIGSYVIRMLGR